MNKLIASVLIFAFSLSASALAPIAGKQGLAIVNTLEKLGMKGQAGAHIEGYVNIKNYNLMGLVCQAGNPTKAGIMGEVEASCTLERITTSKELKQIQAVLQTGGLSPSNSIFKL